MESSRQTAVTDRIMRIVLPRGQELSRTKSSTKLKNEIVF